MPVYNSSSNSLSLSSKKSALQNAAINSVTNVCKTVSHVRALPVPAVLPALPAVFPVPVLPVPVTVHVSVEDAGAGEGDELDELLSLPLKKTSATTTPIPITTAKTTARGGIIMAWN